MRKIPFLHFFPLLLICAALSPLLAPSCNRADNLPEEGVPLTLAQDRSGRISDLSYELFFSVPETVKEPCQGEESISFTLKGDGPVVLDFRSGATSVHSLSVNGKATEVQVVNEHILLPGLRKGKNTVTLSFTPQDDAMNRHEEYMYTLLVPERARTLFPCFDQPDLKAVFTLSLEIPERWVAVSNGPTLEEAPVPNHRKRLSFGPSGLIPTYLFEFTAGMWEKKTFMRGDSPMSIYYRETDPDKVAQLPEVFRQICYALDWMEDFTAMPMPFEKYDAVIVPSFQFGGMEHPGAILLNSSRIFLGKGATISNELSRTELISHETAHLWFGDAVTMRWFNDVWTKEVFANYFAAQITRPLFPDVDFRLNDFRGFNIPAYAEDRTEGSVPIRQELDNLQNAGLVYGNIVYDKAPVVMRMLADTLGTEGFRSGLREYLTTYKYANATWPELIDILDKYSEADLAAWSHSWVEERGMPVYPPSDRPANLDALGYGYYQLTSAGMERSTDTLTLLRHPHERLSNLANLYENTIRGDMDWDSLEALTQSIYTLLRTEDNQLVASSAISYLTDITPGMGHPEMTGELLRDLASRTSLPDQVRKSALTALFHEAKSTSVCEELYRMWLNRETFPGITLSPENYTTLSYELAIRFPQRYDFIRKTELDRISDPDRRERFLFVFPSTSPSKEVRDSVFNSLLDPRNRLYEPWVQSSLGYLNHFLRQEEALGYIVPALDEMKEIQRTGDIFFPKNWIVSVLSGHDSPEAAKIVREWLDGNKEGYPPLLLSKILLAADPLLRLEDRDRQ